ncbi:MFS general substrate transporter [Backusella circina FSU 941]|nr:MFS general substrate transporter [Backusella circina FSU 941]
MSSLKSNNSTLNSPKITDISKIEKAPESNTDPSYEYKSDPENPKNWSKRKRYTGFGVVAVNAFIGYFSSAIYIPATQDIIDEFDTNITIINATIALFLLVNGISTLFWAPLSERVGRRWVYLSAIALYTTCSILCGVSKNIGMFFAFRMLQAVFSSAGQALGGGTVSDLFEPQDHGRATSIFILGTILGPAVAPLCGGYVDQYLGWRWIFYIMTILGGVLTILTFLFVKETLYIPKELTPPPPKTMKERLDKLKFNPLGSLKLLLLPDVILVCIPMSIAFGMYFMMVTLIPTTFGSIYGFSTGSTGLCFLASGLGNIVGSLSAGFVSDAYTQRKIQQNNGEMVKEFRLQPIFFGVPLIPIGWILYGWLLYARVFWFAPLIFMAVNAAGVMYTITISNAYLMNCYIASSASVVSANSFTRNLMGMVFSLLSVTIRTSLGDGWSL